MNKMQMCKAWLREHGDLFIDLVRIYLGCGLVVKAVFLMNHRDFLAQMIGETDATWMGGAFIAQYVILAHLFGGAMLALGMVTRLAALVQLPVLFGAIFAIYLPRYANVEPRQYLEYAGLVAFLLVLFSVFGAGRFSLDYFITRKSREVAGEQKQMATSEAH